MKKLFFALALGIILFCLNAANAQDIEVVVTPKPGMAEQILETVSSKTEAGAKSAACHVKNGSKKAAKYVKDKSIIAADKTGKALKSGGEKAKNATVRGAQKAANFTAKGVKHSAHKIENSADKVIDKTDKKLKCPCYKSDDDVKDEQVQKCNCKKECNKETLETQNSANDNE